MNRITHIPAQPVVIAEGTHPAIGADVRCVWHGFGLVTFDGRTLAMEPAVSTRPEETHAPLVVVDRDLPTTGYRVSWKARTVRQLRTGSTPNPWEVLWVYFDYSDPNHATYFTLKRNGWELGRRDPTGAGGQLFIATGEWGTTPPDLTKFRVINVERKGDTVTVTVPSIGLIVAHDIPFTYGDGVTAATCRTALYCEDAAIECTGWATS